MTFVATLMILASCNKQTSFENANSMEVSIRPLGFQTKSAVSGTAFPQGYDMLVSAYRNLGSHPGDDDTAQDYFEGIQFGYSSDVAGWKSERGPKYYPLDGMLDFLAIAGAGINDAATGIVPTSVTWGESSNVSKKFVAVLPDNSAKFDDILYGASNAQSKSSSGSPMEFKHAMTSVVFLAKCNIAYNSTTNAGITIDNITIDGAKYSGTLTVNNPAAGGGSGSLSASWSSLGSEKEHLAARVWNTANLGTNTSETALSAFNLTGTYTSLATSKFGDAYVIMPPQTAVPFTIIYTLHNGFAADGTTKLDKQMQYQYTPSGTWAMGKKNVYSLDFSLTEIIIKPTVVDWDAVDAEVDVPKIETIYSFGGWQIASGPLAYENGVYVIKDDWNYDSYNSVYGKNNGSTYFSFLEMGELFEKEGFSTSDGGIENLLDPLNGWRIPQEVDYGGIILGYGREGSTVNGNNNKHYALVRLTGVTHAGSSTPVGLLLFPDGLNITGKILNGLDNDVITTGMTGDELNVYIEQGCVFLPASGQNYMGLAFEAGGTQGFYWISTPETSSSDANIFQLYDEHVLFYYKNKEAYLPVRLIKPIISENTIYSFGGYQISKGPLMYEGGQYVIKDNWNYNSFNSVIGKNEGSTYFNYLNMGELFEKSGFDITDGDIDNLLDPFDGWQLPPMSYFDVLCGERVGATVNGYTNIPWSGVSVTDYNYNGILFYPDNVIISVPMSGFDPEGFSLTNSQLNEFLSQGCVFFPQFSSCWSGMWSWEPDSGSSYLKGIYLTSTQNTSMDNSAYFFQFFPAEPYALTMSSDYVTVRLIKAIP